MGRPTAGIKPRDFERILTRHGCVKLRSGKHVVWQAPSGARIVSAQGKQTPFSGVRMAAQALGLTIEELLR